MARIQRVRPTRSSEIASLSSLAVISLFLLYSLAKSRYEQPPALPLPDALFARDIEGDNLPCRYVHKASDQCAFVRANCLDEEAGLISYLQLYYCNLQHVKPIAFGIIALWASLLFGGIGIAASDFLCVNLNTIAAFLGMSESLTGVTFLAFGNGSPDVFSTFAAMSTNSGSLAVGELIGAAGFITAVVAGSMALVNPFRVAKKSFVRDIGFFIVAASFSLVFLRDGILKLWECFIMVGFYVFYVIFVVGWHWWLQRTRRIRLAETSARLHHHIPDHQELEAPNINIDEEAQPVNERTSLVRSESGSSFPKLSIPGTPAWQAQDLDDDNEERDRYLAGIQSNMRVRKDTRSRRNTITPIRPSLLGAIEFRSVLSALEKRAITNRPIGLREYSDDESRSASIVPSNSYPHFVIDGPEPVRPGDGGRRNRAVSQNAVDGMQLHPDLLTGNDGTPETIIYSPIRKTGSTSSHPVSASESSGSRRGSYASNVLASPLTMSSPSGISTPGHAYTSRNGLLAPQSNTEFHQPNYFDFSHHSTPPSPSVSPRMGVPAIKIPHPEDRKSPLLSQFLSSIPSSRPDTPPAISLPAPAVFSPEANHTPVLLEDRDGGPRRYRCWPYAYMPAPQTILAVLFPTIYGYGERGIVGRLAGFVTAPIVFLLTITLPVFEPKDDDEDDEANDATTVPLSPAGRRQSAPAPDTINSFMLSQDAPTSAFTVAKPQSNLPTRQDTGHKFSKLDEIDTGDRQGDWNRWLVMVQLFAAPLFVVLILYANLDETHNSKDLLIYLMSSLVLSLIGLLVILKTSTADRAPRYRPVFCFLGFLVAIAWISTIANEVVGVLKTLGVILNISDAILGLTIFAVGNSLGDLVADITVAKLGFPVMALSACFGGPMLNILLGIGLGGLYMMIHRGNQWHQRHPDMPTRYKPYEVEVSVTLLISGVTLLVTLVGLLIFVPLNGWRMDRKIGIGLIALWMLSTVGNVICEVLGYGTSGTMQSSGS